MTKSAFNTSEHAETLKFDGVLNGENFAAFCKHSAAKLSLHHTVQTFTNERVCVHVRGHETLIDMFEMACSLGPQGSVVLSTSRSSRGDDT